MTHLEQALTVLMPSLAMFFTVLQHCDTHLSQCDILKIDVCPGTGQQVLSITTWLVYTVKAWYEWKLGSSSLEGQNRRVQWVRLASCLMFILCIAWCKQIRSRLLWSLALLPLPCARVISGLYFVTKLLIIVWCSSFIIPMKSFKFPNIIQLIRIRLL